MFPSSSSLKIENKYCADQPDLIDDIATASCPTYANAGCYTGSNAHYSNVNDDVLVEAPSFLIDLVKELFCDGTVNPETCPVNPRRKIHVMIGLRMVVDF